MLHPSVLDDSYKIGALRINKKIGSQKTTQNAKNTKKY